MLPAFKHHLNHHEPLELQYRRYCRVATLMREVSCWQGTTGRSCMTHTSAVLLRMMLSQPNACHLTSLHMFRATAMPSYTSTARRCLPCHN